MEGGGWGPGGREWGRGEGSGGASISCDGAVERRLLGRQGDRLRLTTVVSSVMEINELQGVEILPKENLGLEAIGIAAAVETLVVAAHSGQDIVEVGDSSSSGVTSFYRRLIRKISLFL